MTTKYYVHNFLNNRGEDLGTKTIKGKPVDMDIYLHGYCDVFIIKLFELLEKEYRDTSIDILIGVVMSEGEMVHVFAKLETLEEDYYIDVRGITLEKEIFFEEFQDFFDYDAYFNGDIDDAEEPVEDIEYFYSIKDYLAYMDAFFREDGYYDDKKVLEESQAILDAYKEHYLLPDWMKEEFLDN